MLKIDRERKSFELLEPTTMAGQAIMEREDLQEFIAQSPDAFFSEINEELFVVGKEVMPSDTVQDRIDLLAVDKEGACVVIELKRGSNKLQMLQAISYSGMMSDWSADDFDALLDEDGQEALSDFLECEREDINRKQRIILIAEAYDYALLAGAEWLNDEHGVDINCCRVSLATDKTTDTEYLVCTTVYPAPELAAEAKPRRPPGGPRPRGPKWPDWDTALAVVQNDAVVSFVRERLAANHEVYLPRRTLIYRLGGKRRWNLHARRKLGYAWQIGRFENDIEFWRERLSDASSVKSVKRGEALRMLLLTSADFESFHKAATTKLTDVIWTKSGGSDDELGEDGD